MREVTVCLLTLCIAAWLPGAAHGAALLQPFTVEKGIESERVLTFSGDMFPDSSTPVTDQFALFSPDGSRFVVRTRRGDIARDVNIDTLLLWKQAEVEAALPSGKSLPGPLKLPAHEFHDDDGGLGDLKWESPETLSFLAEAEKGAETLTPLPLLTGMPFPIFGATCRSPVPSFVRISNIKAMRMY